MAWTYQQRIQRATQQLVDKDLVLEDQIETLTRPLFHGQYKFSIGLAATPESWYRYDELKQLVQDGLQDFECSVQSNATLYDFYVYSNDPAVIRWVAKNHQPFHISFVRLIDEAFWKKPPMKVRQKTSFYGQYHWRIRMKNARWGIDDANVERLQGLSGPHKLAFRRFEIDNPPYPVHHRYLDTFVYMEKLSDVMMFKLMVAEDIADIEQR